MKLEKSHVCGRVLLSLHEGRIDAASAIDFKEATRSLTDGESGPVLLDLAEVGFIDSSGLGALVAIRKFLGPDRPFELARLTPAVAKVLRLTRMDTVFAIHADLPASDATDHQNAV